VTGSHTGRLTIVFATLFFLALGLPPGPARADIGAFVLIDANSGAVIEEDNATRKWYPASLTKMMTAYVTFKAIREGRASLNSAVVQSKNSLSEPPSKMGFKVGTRFTVDTALKIILIKSANDVAVALGEAVAGSEAGFIAMMNAEARRLGMSNTYFTNPHGLPDNRQVTTARDMAILAMALRRDFPESRKFYEHPGIRFGKKTLRSANREFLLRVPGANGMKTGYICNSGYNVAASVTRGNRTLIAVILGAGSGLERTAFARQLFDEGFRKRGGRNISSLTGRPAGRRRTATAGATRARERKATWPASTWKTRSRAVSCSSRPTGRRPRSTRPGSRSPTASPTGRRSSTGPWVRAGSPTGRCRSRSAIQPTRRRPGPPQRLPRTSRRKTFPCRSPTRSGRRKSKSGRNFRRPPVPASRAPRSRRPRCVREPPRGLPRSLLRGRPDGARIDLPQGAGLHGARSRAQPAQAIVILTFPDQRRRAVAFNLLFTLFVNSDVIISVKRLRLPEGKR
jgi:D-alanyl-D-alanine carboxypeptidase